MPVPSAGYWNFWSGGASGVVYLAMLGPAFIVSPGLLQKMYGARDDRAVRLGVGANAVGLLLYAIVPALLGMIARARFPDLATPDLALPTILMRGAAGGDRQLSGSPRSSRPRSAPPTPCCSC